METDYQGNSLGFYGSNRVEASQIDLFWRRLFSKEQRENTKNIVPIEYASLDIDGAGFVYAVTAESKNSQYEIKKLHPKGTRQPAGAGGGGHGARRQAEHG